MAKTHLTIRIDADVKAKAEKASVLLGLKSLSEYVVKLMDENASQIIAQHESMTLDADVFDRFRHACEQTRKPNKALQDAAAFTKVNRVG